MRANLEQPELSMSDHWSPALSCTNGLRANPKAGRQGLFNLHCMHEETASEKWEMTHLRPSGKLEDLGPSCIVGVGVVDDCQDAGPAAAQV